jgi:hypothetical protein
MTRRAKLSGIIVLLAVTGACVLSAQKDSGNIPPGISPARWIPLTETSGVVLKEPVFGRERILDHGKLMVKVHDTWREVYLDQSPDTFTPARR